MIFDPKVIEPVTTVYDVEAYQKGLAEEDRLKPAPTGNALNRWYRRRVFFNSLERYIPLRRIRNAIFTPERRSNHLFIPTLTGEYSDPVHVLVHANFTVLVNFIEGEQPFRVTDMDYTAEHRRVGDEMVSLYNWWKTDPFAQEPTGPENFYSMNVKELLEYGRSIYGDEGNWIADAIEKSRGEKLVWFEIEEAAEARIQENLIRLIKIRRSLWT